MRSISLRFLPWLLCLTVLMFVQIAQTMRLGDAFPPNECEEVVVWVQPLSDSLPGGDGLVDHGFSGIEDDALDLDKVFPSAAAQVAPLYRGRTIPPLVFHPFPGPFPGALLRPPAAA